MSSTPEDGEEGLQEDVLDFPGEEQEHGKRLTDPGHALPEYTSPERKPSPADVRVEGEPEPLPSESDKSDGELKVEIDSTFKRPEEEARERPNDDDAGSVEDTMSIPDDSPSIQVQAALLHRTNRLIYIGFYRVFSSQRIPYFP